MTNPAVNIPTVCDTCLSPSRLGETSKSLKLPPIGIVQQLDMAETSGKKSPKSLSGIRTNPRMMNSMLPTLREGAANRSNDSEVFKEGGSGEELTFADRNGFDDNSFDSLLSPSKAADLFSGDDLEVSSDEGDELDSRLIKIKPKIKVRGRNRSSGDVLGKRYVLKERKLSLQTESKHLSTKMSQTRIFSLPSPPSQAVFHVSSSRLPFLPEQFPIMAPPTPFRTRTRINQPTKVFYFPNLVKEVNTKQEKIEDAIKVGVTDEAQCKGSRKLESCQSVTQLTWDSTFEAIKTLETSMKMEVTPVPKRRLRESLEEASWVSPSESVVSESTELNKGQLIIIPHPSVNTTK